MTKDLEKLYLINHRDNLFDKYLDLYDKYLKWANGKGKLAHFRVTGKKETRAQLAMMIKVHLNEISVELRDLDTRICAYKSPDHVYIVNSEIY